MTWFQLKTLLNTAKVQSDGRESYSFAGGAR
jgi:hypothetical protein